MKHIIALFRSLHHRLEDHRAAKKEVRQYCIALFHPAFLISPSHRHRPGFKSVMGSEVEQGRIEADGVAPAVPARRCASCHRGRRG